MGYRRINAIVLILAAVACQRQPTDTAPVQPALEPSPTPVPQAMTLLPAISGHLYGFIDVSGKFQISPQFTAARAFRHGLAAVRVGGTDLDRQSPRGTTIVDDAGRIGFIDTTGHFSINPIYTCARDFSKDVAIVAKSSSTDREGRKRCTDWQAIDIHGNELFPRTFEVAGRFGDDLLNVEISEHIQVTAETVVQDCTSDNAKRHGYCLPEKRIGPTWVDSKKFGAVDIKGAWVIEPRYQRMSAFQEGIAFVSQDCDAALIDHTGTQLTKFVFESCISTPGGFSEGLSTAAVAGSGKRQVGYIDKAGKFVIPPLFDRGASFREGLAAVDAGGLWGYINPSGALVINPAFKIAAHFRHHKAYVCTSEGFIALIDDHGNIEQKTKLSCEAPHDTSDPIGPYFPVVVNDFYVGTDIADGAQIWLSAEGREIYREHVGPAESASTGGDQTKSTKSKMSGTAFTVSDAGFLLTNAHVVAGCERVELPATKTTADVIKVDIANDLALLRAKIPATEIPSIAKADSVVLGTDIVIFGFPLPGVISSSGNLSTGVISGLTGLKEDSRFFQLTAPLQPGNSGGPVINRFGEVIGVASATLDPRLEFAASGSLPQNVNFAIGPNMIRQFLTVQGAQFRESSRWMRWKKDTDTLAASATKFTFQIICSSEPSQDAEKAAN
jgi:Trypsin-like peptidase domain/WG containing repeat